MNAKKMFGKLGYGALVLAAFMAGGLTLGVASAATGGRPAQSQPAAVQPAPAAAAADLSAGLGNGATVLGMPKHSAVLCTDVSVVKAERSNLQGKVPVLDHTKPLSVKTNYGETATIDAAGNITTTYGLSGTVQVCFGPTDDAPDYGVIGLGTAPAVAAATVEYLPGTYQYTSSTGVHGDYDVNVRLTSDGTFFPVTVLNGTEFTARIGEVKLVVDCTSSPCEVQAPENGTFFRLGREGMYVILHIVDDGSNLPTIGIVTP